MAHITINGFGLGLVEVVGGLHLGLNIKLDI